MWSAKVAVVKSDVVILGSIFETPTKLDDGYIRWWFNWMSRYNS